MENYEKKKIDSQKNKKILKGVGLVVLGMMIGGMIVTSPSETKVETKEVEVVKTQDLIVTPQSCKDVIELDNEIFTRIADMLSIYPSTAKVGETSEFITNNTEQRTANISDCYKNIK